MLPIWFTKSRRAQTNDDYETWVEGGVTPTLNILITVATQEPLC